MFILTYNQQYFALALDQDVQDYFDIHDKNQDNTKSIRDSESHKSQLICIDKLTSIVWYENTGDLP